MALRRRVHGGAFVILLAATAACNLITGAPDRVLDDSDAAVAPPSRDGGTSEAEPGDAATVPPIVDSSLPDDGAPLGAIEVSKTFTSPNGAQFTTSTAGTRITGYTTFSHPAIMPVPQPSIPSEDYTVTATVLAQEKAEFGLLTRGQPDGGAVVFGSVYGGVAKPFLGAVAADWNPSLQAQGPAYTFKTGTRYRLSAKVQGTQVSGKMWEAAQAEPDWQVIAIAPWATGKQIGFYVYATTTPVVESMTVTVP